MPQVRAECSELRSGTCFYVLHLAARESTLWDLITIEKIVWANLWKHNDVDGTQLTREVVITRLKGDTSSSYLEITNAQSLSVKIHPFPSTQKKIPT